MTKTKPITGMADLLEAHGAAVVPFRSQEVVEVTITAITKSKIWVDVANLTTGFIPDREFSFDVSTLKVGDKVLAQVIMPENEDGYVIFSLRRADRERIWRTLEEKHTTADPLAVRVTAANRGGLIVDFAGIEGFLPVSHLASNHYPKVEGGDTTKILAKLRELMNQDLQVKVINFDRTAGKLIFSERAAGDEKMEQAISRLKVEDIVKVTISGIVDFGLFVRFKPAGLEEDVEGLIHISEVSWERVDDLGKRFKVGEKIDAKVISLEDGRVSFSLKRLGEDPWEKGAAKLTVGTKLKGEVTRVTPFGSFVKLGPGVEGLVHRDATTKPLEVGSSHQFTIVEVDANAHKISLSMKEAKSAAKANTLSDREIKSRESKGLPKLKKTATKKVAAKG